MGNVPTMVVVVAVIVGAIIAAVYFAKRRPQRAPVPKRDGADPWDRYLANGASWSDRDRTVIEALRELPRPETDRIKEAVHRVLTEALGADDPQTALRRAVMDATDRFVLAEVLGGGGQSTAPGDLQSVVEVGVLRCAAMLRFGDYDKNDWYTHYLNVAEMNSRNVAAMVRKTVDGDLASFESSLHDPLTRTMAEVRKTLLHHPARTAVERAHKLTTAVESLRLSPTQRQIDELSRIMHDRFEKLFAGQVYRLERGTAADPTGTFQVDAGVLYTVLALNFQHATEAWRHIMGEALGPYREAMDDEQRLLNLARECHSTWVQHREHGPLHETLRTACRGAFKSSEGWETIAKGMLEDASYLSGELQRVAKSSWQPGDPGT